MTEFVMDQTKANALEGLVGMAAKARSGIQMVEFKFELGSIAIEVRSGEKTQIGHTTMTVTATDSYTLVQQNIRLSPVDEAELPPVTVLEAKPLFEILKKARSNALVTLEFGEDEAIVTVQSKGTTMTAQIPHANREMVKYQSLLDGVDWSDEDRRYSSDMVALHPERLAQVPVHLGQAKNGKPIRVYTCGSLKPVGFRVFDGEDVIAQSLLMPFRV